MKTFLTISTGLVLTAGILSISWLSERKGISYEKHSFGNGFTSEQLFVYSASELLHFKNQNSRSLYKEPVSDKVWFHAFMNAKKQNKAYTRR